MIDNFDVESLFQPQKLFLMSLKSFLDSSIKVILFVM